MVILNCQFYSHVLRMDTSMSILLPQKKHEPITNTNPKYPVLYLLHGQSQDHTAWIRHSNIETYLASREVSVVMPNVHKSFYCDMINGDNYFTYLSKEIPEFVQKYFPLSDKREDTYVAGLSMGGYGAFKLALTFPEQYKWAASLSGAVDIANVYTTLYNQIENHEDLNDQQKEYINIFGTKEDLDAQKNDLRKLAVELDRTEGKKPTFYQCCGIGDYLYEQNCHFKDFVHSNTSLNLLFENGDGDHNWYYWNQKLYDVLVLSGLMEQNKKDL